MVKKLTVFVLSTVLALSLAACGGAVSSIPSPAEAETTVTGTVTDATMNTTTIQTSDGKELTFAMEGADISMKDGLLLGDVVAITYKGDLKDGDTTGVTVVKMTDGADNSTNPLRQEEDSMPTEGEIAPEGDAMITGVVVAAGMSATTIQTDDGTELSFLTDEAEKTVTDGIQEGKRVTIVYTGEILGTDTSAVTVLLIEDPAE